MEFPEGALEANFKMQAEDPAPQEPVVENPKPDPEPGAGNTFTDVFKDNGNDPAKKEEPKFNETEYLSSIGFQSKDEIAKMREEYESIKSAPRAESSIDDPVLFGLNKIKKDRPDDFNFFMKLKLQGDVDPVELLMSDYIRKNPSKKDNPDLVRDFIRRKYGLDKKIPKPLVEDDATPEEIEERNEMIRDAKREVEFAEMQMEEDVTRIKGDYEREFEGFLKDYNVTTPEKVAEMAKPWAPVAKKFMNNLKSVPIYLPGPEGKMQKFLDFSIPENQVSALENAIVDFAVASKLPMEEGAVKNIYEYVMGQVYGANMFQINHAIAEKARSMTEEEYDKAYRNPSPMFTPTPQGQPEENPFEKSQREALRLEGVNI